MKNSHETTIYTACLADIALIEEMFPDGRCKDQALARSRLKETKAKWNEFIRQNKGSEIEGVVQTALTRLPKVNHRTDSWYSRLYDSAGEFRYHLAH